MLLGRDHIGDSEILQPRAGIFDRFHFQTDGGQLVGNGGRIRIGVERRLQPGERELHRLSPPSSVGTSRAANPKWRSHLRSDSKNGRISGMPYFSIARRSSPPPNAKPEYFVGSMPHISSTRGCTMPEPASSSQSL